MRMNFKRTFSGLLAFILMLSSLVVVNTASVSAAETVIEWSFTDASAWGLSAGNKGSYSLKNSTKCSNTKEKYTLTYYSDSNNDKFYDSTYSGDYKGIAMNGGMSDTGRNNWTKRYFEVAVPAKGKISVTAVVNGTTASNGVPILYKWGAADNSVSASDSGTTKTKVDETTTFDIVNEADTEKTLYFGFSAKQIITGVKLTLPDSSGEPASNYTWTLDTSLISDEIKGNLLYESETPTAYNTLKYEDSDYTLLRNFWTISPSTKDEDSTAIVTQGDGDKAYVIKPTKKMFLKNVTLNADNIKIKDAKSKVLHLQCTHGVVFSFLLGETPDDAGYYKPVAELVPNAEGKGGYAKNPVLSIPAHADDYTATMGGGKLSIQDFPLNDESASFTADFTATPQHDIEADVPEIKFSELDLKAATDTRGERVLGGTVLDEAGHFFVLGTHYNNTYKLSNLANDSEPSGKIKAIVLRTTNTTDEQGGIGFKLAGVGTGDIKEGTTFDVKVKCVAVKDRVLGGLDETTIGIGEYDADKAMNGEGAFTATQTKKIDAQIDPLNNPDTDDDVTSTIVTFEGLTPGKTYGIYNPGEEETQGNVRIYSIAVDMKQSGEEESDLGYVDEGEYAFGSGTAEFNSVYNVNGFVYKGFKVSNPAGKESTCLYLKSAGTIEFKVKSAATLSVDCTYKGVKVTGTDSTDETISTGSYDSTKIPLKADVVYTITGTDSSSSSKIKHIKIESGEPAPASAVITGDVTLSDVYTYVKHEGVTSDKLDADKYDNNVTFDDTNGGTVQDNTLTIPKTITDLTVTVTGPDGDTPVSDVKIGDDNKSYTIGGATEGGLEPGEYSITITADGGATKTITATVGDDKQSVKAETAALETPTYTVRFVTNIKNFKSGDRKDVPSIVTEDGSKTLFQLDDKTYYYIDRLSGGDYTDVQKVASAESTTHIVKMPKGNYKYVYTSDYYKLSQDRAGKDETLTFDVGGNSTKHIYFIPQIDTTLDSANVMGKVTEGQESVSDSVKVGKYTLEPQSGATSVKDATVTFAGKNGDNKATGMVAYGIEGGDTSNKYFGLNENNGAVVFKLDQAMLAHITTEQQACVLYNVEKQATINGSSSIIPTDSSFSKRTITLGAGTYALVSMADSSSSKSPAKVTEIEFIGGSPFKVTEDAKDYESDGKMIIGQYDSSNDDQIGTANAGDYSVFAILIANNAEDLTVDKINNIVSFDGYDSSPAKSSPSDEGSDTDKYTPNVNVLTVRDGKVVVDATTDIFGRIVGENGEDIIKDDKNGVLKYYATVIKGTAGDTFYAVGAAKLNGSETAEKGDTWLIQDEDPVTITFNS